MPKYTFVLRIDRNTPTDQRVPVRFLIRWNGHTLTYPTGEAIPPRYWCSVKGQRNYQRAKETRSFPEHPEFNERLDGLLSTAKAAFRSFVTDNSRDPEPSELKRAIDAAMGKGQPRRLDLLAFVADFIAKGQGSVNPRTGKPYHSTYHGRNRVTLDLLTQYIDAHRKGARIPFSALDADFVEGFTKYLTTTKGHAVNTVGKYVRALRMFVNVAAEDGHEINPSFRSKRITVPEERTEQVYLNEAELLDLSRLDLSRSPRLDRARDLFLVGCWTGLRFGDFSTLQPENIEGARIRVRPKKTGNPVVIPLHPIVQAIVAKYGGTFPPTISNQKLNKYVKEFAALCPSLQHRVSDGITKGGVRREVMRWKYEQVSTHTARRSFASNAYTMKVPTRSIMAITGHRTEAAFMRYIRLDGEQHADLLASTPMFSVPTNLQVA